MVWNTPEVQWGVDVDYVDQLHYTDTALLLYLHRPAFEHFIQGPAPAPAFYIPPISTLDTVGEAIDAAIRALDEGIADLDQQAEERAARRERLETEWYNVYPDMRWKARNHRSRIPLGSVGI